MDLSDKDKFSSEQRNDDHLNYQHQSSTMSTSWPFATSNLTDQPMGLLPINGFVPTCTGDVLGSSNCSSVSMVESFSPNIWGNPNSQNLGLSDNVQAGANIGKAGLGTGSAFLAQTLSQFPADSAFIERAARFSCFTGGGFTDMLNPFNVAGSVNRHFKDGQAIQGPPEVVGDDGMNLKHNSGTQSPINEPMNMKEISEYGLGRVNRDVIECSPTEKLKRMGSSIRPSDEEKQEIGASSNESYEPEVSGSGGQGEPSGGQPSSSKGFGLRKRKRIDQDTEINKDETLKESSETKQKIAQTPGKATKHNKDSSRNSDAPKEDYIHVRARRGQATNSHSLAERVRREKISERMKFLQDLVPGCNKVTGKAVMLDEIINYVQSLQRQVEFLSMKLAAVNPRLDLNTEALLAKDVREALQSRGGSSTFPFSQDARMVHPRTHPTQPGLIQPRIHGMENSSDALGRTNYSQLLAINGGIGGYRGPATQIPNMWDDELNNVLQMNFGTNSSFNGQDTNASQQPGHMKDEL